MDGNVNRAGQSGRILLESESHRVVFIIHRDVTLLYSVDGNAGNAELMVLKVRKEEITHGSVRKAAIVNQPGADAYSSGNELDGRD